MVHACNYHLIQFITGDINTEELTLQFKSEEWASSRMINILGVLECLWKCRVIGMAYKVKVISGTKITQIL